jgi:hypothetical protein
MIHEATEEILTRGFSNPEQMKDRDGTIGYLVEYEGQLCVLVAKQYAYQNLASFMAPLVRKADDDVLFIFYCDKDETYTVFNGEFLKENGSPSTGESKTRNCSWIEISRDHGVTLDDYLAGRDRPDTIAGENEQLSTFM